MPSTPESPQPILESYQSARRVLMVRPGSFGRNQAAADTNAFMRQPDHAPDEIARLAREEFDALAQALAHAGVDVVIEDEPDLPDSVFPNNWFSYHEPIGRDPVLLTYPMATPLRRAERRASTIDRIVSLAGERVEHIRMEGLEDQGESLEGTGALVLDRKAGVAFVCRSPRATDPAIRHWCEKTGCEAVVFSAFDEAGGPIYHTNVVMMIGTRISIICSEVIRDTDERRRVLDRLESLGKRIVDITPTQMGSMCANALELSVKDGDPILAMSETAWGGFTPEQRALIEGEYIVVRSDIRTIERVGGGSVRCMIAELGGHACSS